MNKRSAEIEAQVGNTNSVEKKNPLGWNTAMDSDGETVQVKFRYWAHHKIDNDRRPDEYYMDFSFPKQDIMAMIPEEGYKNPFALVNYERKLDDRRWTIIQDISRTLADDFKEIQSKTRSTSDMYAELLRKFASESRYQKPMESLARFEAIIWLLKKPKAFNGGDIRDRM